MVLGQNVKPRMQGRSYPEGLDSLLELWVKYAGEQRLGEDPEVGVVGELVGAAVGQGRAHRGEARPALQTRGAVAALLHRVCVLFSLEKEG